MQQIDLIGFLCNYYGITSEYLKANKLTHADVKILFPNIKRTSFIEMKNNLSLVYNGEIILVYDCHGKILPYLNPHLEINDCFVNEDSYAENDLIDIKEVEIETLSKEELLHLRKLLKIRHQRSSEKVIVQAIRNKKDHQVINYKMKKMFLKMEE